MVVSKKRLADTNARCYTRWLSKLPGSFSLKGVKLLLSLTCTLTPMLYLLLGGPSLWPDWVAECRDVMSWLDRALDAIYLQTLQDFLPVWLFKSPAWPDWELPLMLHSAFSSWRILLSGISWLALSLRAYGPRGLYTKHQEAQSLSNERFLFPPFFPPLLHQHTVFSSECNDMLYSAWISAGY